MKVALVHDTLINHGGAERVFSIFLEIFPDADIYTSVYLPERTYPIFKAYNIQTTPLQKILKSERLFKLTFPLALFAMNSLVLKDLDVVLTSSTFCAKYVKVLRPAIHICYCYTPFRLIWQPESYLKPKTSRLQEAALRNLSRIFKAWDFAAAQKINHFIAMTSETQQRIKESYGRNSTIIMPPIDCSQFRVSKHLDNFFLVVSRLEAYKKVDIVIDAFNKMELNLKIVGNGTQKAKLQQMAKRNIEFLQNVSDVELYDLYSRCQAVIFPQKEDYGLVPLEANASGRPVIAYGQGGILETSVPYENGRTDVAPTAIFFFEQSSDAIIDAVDRYYAVDFNPELLKKHAHKFDKPVFKAAIKNFVLRVALMEANRKNNTSYPISGC